MQRDRDAPHDGKGELGNDRPTSSAGEGGRPGQHDHKRSASKHAPPPTLVLPHHYTLCVILTPPPSLISGTHAPDSPLFLLGQWPLMTSHSQTPRISSSLKTTVSGSLNGFWNPPPPPPVRFFFEFLPPPPNAPSSQRRQTTAASAPVHPPAAPRREETRGSFRQRARGMGSEIRRG